MILDKVKTAREVAFIASMLGFKPDSITKKSKRKGSICPKSLTMSHKAPLFEAVKALKREKQVIEPSYIKARNRIVRATYGKKKRTHG